MKSQSAICTIVLFFFPKVAVVIQSLLWFDINARIFCSISVKNIVGILIGICIDLWAVVCIMDFLTVLTRLIHGHRVSFHFFVPSTMYFYNVLRVFLANSFYLSIFRGCHSTLSWPTVSEGAVDSVMGVYLEVAILFSLAAFKILCHWSLTVLTSCPEEVLFALSQLEFLLASRMCMSSSFPRFGKFSAISPLNVSNALCALPSLSEIPISLTLPFLMEQESCCRISSLT